MGQWDLGGLDLLASIMYLKIKPVFSPFNFCIRNRTKPGMMALQNTLNLIVPLYIYPFPNTWDPLYQAIEQYPDLDFTVIVNPHNGPGAGDLPDDNYMREVTRLNSLPNVTIVGYVRIDYCRRPLPEALVDIKKYGGWVSQSSKLGLQGIFVDESPNLWTKECGEYLTVLDMYIKATEGLGARRLTIHNPGTVPDIEYTTPGPDVTTIVEESLANWETEALRHRTASLLNYARDRCAFMIHSVPPASVGQLVKELQEFGKYIFITDNTDDYYVKFGKYWNEFVAAMAPHKVVVELEEPNKSLEEEAEY